MFDVIEETEAVFDGLDAPTRQAWVQTLNARIYSYLRHARFDVDPATGAPTDGDVRERIRLAAVTQAMAWKANGYDPANPAKKNRPTSSLSLGPASVSFVVDKEEAQTRQQIEHALTGDAMAWLRPLLHQPAY